MYYGHSEQEFHWVSLRPCVWEYHCKWKRKMIPGYGTRDMFVWKDPEVQNRRKPVFNGACEKLGKYHPDLFVVIQLCFRGAVPVAQDEQERRRERRLNRENQTCNPGQECLVLKRHKSCQFICSLLRIIRVVKEGRSTLCYYLILLLCSEHWFLMQFLYRQSIYFVWWNTSNLWSHTNLWGCSVPRHMGLWRLAGSVSAWECSVSGSAVIWALGYIFSLGSHLSH